MKVIFSFLIFLLSFQAYSSFRVMSFNTTCSYLCEKGKFDKFSKRKHWIVDTIKRVNPDLIGLQEVLTSRQLRWFKRKLKNYHLVYYRRFYIFRYADPAILVKKDRFKISRHGGSWLGPLGRLFSLGWSPRFPRRIQWVKVKDKLDNKEYYFSTAHFDNHKKNKTKSAKVFTDMFSKTSTPVIFAADTNLKPHMDGFKHLNQSYFDSFNLKENLEVLSNTSFSNNDICNLEKGKTFPQCRVDHIMLTKKYNWKVSNWGADLFKYGNKQRFTSDHRAIYADINLIN